MCDETLKVEGLTATCGKKDEYHVGTRSECIHRTGIVSTDGKSRIIVEWRTIPIDSAEGSG